MSERQDAEQQAHRAEQLAELGLLGPAIALYQQLLSRVPDFADAWYNLGRLLRRADFPLESLEAYRRALLCGARDPEEVHLNRAVIYADELHQAEAAERELRRALVLNPRYRPALMNLGNLQEDRGERNAALRTYESVLALEPRAYQALARYTQLFDIDRPEHPLIGQLRAALAAATAAAERAELGFALARALDSSGAYPQAFEAAALANAASRASATPPPFYDRLAHERYVDEIISAFPVDSGFKTETIGQGPQPIFICGMFRSGSTLAESLLAGHPAVTAGGELPLLPRLIARRFSPFPGALVQASTRNYAQAAAEYCAGLTLRFPQAQRVTDKRPDNFLYIGLIKRLFPAARIVHTTRDPLDTCLSIFFLHLDHRQSYALDLRDIGHYFRQYRRLMAHWHACCGEELLEFNYDRLVREPRPQLQRLLTFLGLDWHEDCLDFSARARSVRTASVWQVRQGLYRHASGRAQHYLRELADLARELQRP